MRNYTIEIPLELVKIIVQYRLQKRINVRMALVQPLTKNDERAGERIGPFHRDSNRRALVVFFQEIVVAHADGGASVNVHRLVQHHSSSLRGLLLQRPPQSGVMDVLGYLQIASDDGHRIDEDLPEDVVIRSGLADDREIVVTIPRVVFSSKAGDSLPAS